MVPRMPWDGHLGRCGVGTRWVQTAGRTTAAWRVKCRNPVPLGAVAAITERRRGRRGPAGGGRAMNPRHPLRGLTAVGLGSMLAGAVVLIGVFPGDAGAAPDQAQSTPSTSVVDD